MKTLKLSFLAVLACGIAAAQTTTPSATLCAAITSITQNVICLSSITSVVGQTSLFIDGEFLQVVGTPTIAASVRVARSTSSGSGPQLHANGSQVWLALTPGYTVVPGQNGFAMGANLAPPTGSACTRASQAYLPKIYPNLGQLFDCDASTNVWRPYLGRGPVVYVTDAGAANAITSPVGSAPAYTGMLVSVTLAHALQAGADTFAYNGGTALNIKSSRNPANNIGTAYVSGAVVNLTLASISGTLTWLDISQ
jgi:hypothetical protein